MLARVLPLLMLLACAPRVCDCCEREAGRAACGPACECAALPGAGCDPAPVLSTITIAPTSSVLADRHALATPGPSTAEPRQPSGILAVGPPPGPALFLAQRSLRN